jgi:hypothetical protein
LLLNVNFNFIFNKIFNYYHLTNIFLEDYNGDWGLGIGDWGLGIGDWGLGPIPNPQSPFDFFIFDFKKLK